MNKEMERNDWLSLVLYILVVQEILIKLHLGPNREAYSTKKGRMWAFVNKPVWDKSVNQNGGYFNFHVDFWWRSYSFTEDIQVR